MNKATIAMTEGRETIDDVCKNVLKDKKLLAQILKETVKEVRDFSYDDIFSFIEGEPKVSEVAVHPNEGKPNQNPNEVIAGRATESNIVDEGVVYFDVVFDIAVPGLDRTMRIIINVEAQNKFNPGYSIITRAVYYCARMISQQKNVEFINSDYDNIRKVYSIWICFAPQENRDSITEFSIRQNNVYGNLEDKTEAYDKMSVILVCLNDKEETNNRLIGLLGTLFSKKLSAEERAARLEKEYGFKIGSDLEKEVGKMCNYSELLLEEGREEGRAEEKINFVCYLLRQNKPDSEIRAIVGCEQKLIEKARSRVMTKGRQTTV